MKHVRPSLIRTARLTGILILPVVAVGLVMLVRGSLQALDGLIGLVFVTGVVSVMARRHLAAMDALRDYADHLIVEDEQMPEEVRDGARATRQVAAAVSRLARAGWDRTDELSRKLNARETVLDAIVDPILTLDPDGRILHANRSARTLFGAAVVGRAFTAVLRNPSLLQAIETAQAGGEGARVELQLADPVERDFVVSVKPLNAVSPDGSRLILAFHDVTAQHVAEQQRTDFVANVSHELRTPLATLIGFIETLQGPAKEDPQAQERFLGIMQDQAQRMSRLVNDLLSLSRIQLNEHVPPTGSVDVGELLERVVHALEVNAAKREVALDLKRAKKLPLVIGDADELQQLFQNLIDNAIKYGAAKQPVTIVAEPATTLPASLPRTAKGAIAISVTDRGEGIPRQHLPRLTERFYRVDPARSRAVGGTGLGLAIVKHIVNRHRGALLIESELKKGSTFTIYLPIAAR